MISSQEISICSIVTLSGCRDIFLYHFVEFSHKMLNCQNIASYSTPVFCQIMHSDILNPSIDSGNSSFGLLLLLLPLHSIQCHILTKIMKVIRRLFRLVFSFFAHSVLFSLYQNQNFGFAKHIFTLTWPVSSFASLQTTDYQNVQIL